jgi:hypothetical protein
LLIDRKHDLIWGEPALAGAGSRMGVVSLTVLGGAHESTSHGGIAELLCKDGRSLRGIVYSSEGRKGLEIGKGGGEGEGERERGVQVSTVPIVRRLLGCV